MELIAKFFTEKKIFEFGCNSCTSSFFFDGINTLSISQYKSIKGPITLFYGEIFSNISCDLIIEHTKYNYNNMNIPEDFRLFENISDVEDLVGCKLKAPKNPPEIYICSEMGTSKNSYLAYCNCFNRQLISET